MKLHRISEFMDAPCEHVVSVQLSRFTIDLERFYELIERTQHEKNELDRLSLSLAKPSKGTHRLSAIENSEGERPNNGYLACSPSQELSSTLLDRAKLLEQLNAEKTKLVAELLSFVPGSKGEGLAKLEFVICLIDQSTEITLDYLACNLEECLEAILTDDPATFTLQTMLETTKTSQEHE